MIEVQERERRIVDTYIHSNNRHCGIGCDQGGDDTIAKDIAMHLLTVNQWLSVQSVSKELLAKI